PRIAHGEGRALLRGCLVVLAPRPAHVAIDGLADQRFKIRPGDLTKSRHGRRRREPRDPPRALPPRSASNRPATSRVRPVDLAPARGDGAGLRRGWSGVPVLASPSSLRGVGGEAGAIG